MKTIFIQLLPWWTFVFFGALAVASALVYRLRKLQPQRPHPPFPEKPDQPPEAAGPEKEFVRRLQEAVHVNLANPTFTVATLARCLHLSEDTLLRKTRALTGKTPGGLIRQVRLARARQLLRETNRTITDIALETGFNSPDAFGRVFKQEEGQPPSHWRKSKGGKAGKN